MARRRRRQRKKFSVLRILLGTRWGRRFVAVANLCVLVAGVFWYFQQPPSRQKEIERLVGNYFEREKDIQFLELALDLYHYYYGAEFTSANYSNDEELLFAGAPSLLNGENARVLRNQGFVCGYSESRRSPLWVAYRLFDQDGIGGAGERPKDFFVDERTIAKVHSSEYTRSGYDRGHLAPNFGIARCYGQEAQTETFSMSNIVPQKHEMNAGLWRFLEERSAVNYTGRFGEVWVVTGPVFGQQVERIGKGVPIPEACFKILLDETEGKLRAQAFIVPQNASMDAGLNRFLVSIDEVERRTQLDFFPDLPDETEGILEARTPTRLW